MILVSGSWVIEGRKCGVKKVDLVTVFPYGPKYEHHVSKVKL